MRLIVLSLVLAVTAGGAAAQTTPGSVPPGLNVFFSPAGQPFRAKGAESYPAAIWFAQADGDKDGKIGHEEFLLNSMAFFIALDQNKDNLVNSPENTRYETQIAPEITRIDPRITQPRNNLRKNDDPDMGADRSTFANRYIKRIQGASQYGLIDEPQPVRGADLNLDFRVSDAEWVAASEQRFTVLDRNSDGFIARDELVKTPAQLAAEGFIAGDGKKKKGWFGGN